MVRPNASCSGLSTGIAAIVVQFGLAMMPFGSSRAASGLTSETISGTSSSLRHAEELSTTVAPAAANTGAHSREVDPPAENRAMSTSLTDSSVTWVRSSTVMSSPLNSSTVPAERGEAKKRTLSAGKLRSVRMSRITRPTWPVAPTTARVVIESSF